MRTGGHTFGYFIQLYPSYNFQLQHEELAEVEQGGAMFNTGRAVTDQEVVTLNGVEPGMISGLLYYAYTGIVTITKHKLMNKTKI